MTLMAEKPSERSRLVHAPMILNTPDDDILPKSKVDV